MIAILCGKSGSGKDYISKRMISDYGYIPIVSWTSRPIRENETDGVEYNFCSKREFEYMIENDKLIEYRKYNTLYNGVEDVWFYGLIKEEFDKDKDYIVILDLNGTESFMNYVGEDNCTVFYIDCDDEVRTDRAKQRGSFDETEWNRRLKADAKDFSFDKIRNVADFIIYNNNESIELITEQINKMLPCSGLIPKFK